MPSALPRAPARRWTWKRRMKNEIGNVSKSKVKKMRPATARRCKCDRPSRRTWNERTISAPRPIGRNSGMSKIAKSVKKGVRETILIIVSPGTLGAQTLRTLWFCAHSRHVQKDGAKKTRQTLRKLWSRRHSGQGRRSVTSKNYKKKQKRTTNTRDKT